MKKAVYDKIIVFSFLAVIFIFLLGIIFLPKSDFSEEENRALEEFPDFSVESLIEGEWTRDFETYLNDHSPLRTFFVSAKSQAQILLGYKEINGVYLAKDDYYLQKIDATMEDAVKSIEEMAVFKENNPDKNFVVSIVPSASHVLEDKMPDFATPFDEYEFQQKAAELLGESYVDLSDDLSGNEQQIYYKNDHHWTSNGAYIGFKEISKSLDLEIEDDYTVTKVSDSFLGTTYSKGCFFGAVSDEVLRYDLNTYDGNYNMYIPEIDTTFDSVYFDENLEKKDEYLYFLGENRALIEINTDSNTSKEITVIKDSIANSFIPFLIPYYDKINVVDLRFFREDLEALMADSDDILILYYMDSVDEPEIISKLNFTA